MQQIRLRADRIGASTDPGSGSGTRRIYLLAESNLEIILAAVEEAQPAAIVMDSIQTTYSEALDSVPGSVSQVRHVTMQLLNLAKPRDLPVFLIGHITQDGSIAGPKALEHIVDVVLISKGSASRITALSAP